jgi:hypothetical protein
MAKVAVENGLSDVKDALQSNGYEVVSIDQVGEAACAVITGEDHNMMGMANTQTKASVIQADGLSANEIVDQVKQRIQQIK